MATHNLTCPTCGRSEPLEGQYLTDFSEMHGHYDGYLCSNCRHFWTLEELEDTMTDFVTQLGCAKCGATYPENRAHVHVCRPGDVKQLRHRQADPHCTCNDCIADHIADEVTDTEDTEAEENPREKGDDDGVEYGDPRDERDERRYGDD